MKKFLFATLLVALLGGATALAIPPADAIDIDTGASWVADAPGATTFNVTGAVQLLVGQTVPHGTITPHVTTAVAQGDSITFTFAPDSGYAVSLIHIDNVSQPYTATTYTFTNVQADHIITVSFSATAPPPSPTPHSDPMHSSGNAEGCSLSGVPATAGSAAGWCLPYLSLGLCWLLGRRRK